MILSSRPMERSLPNGQVPRQNIAIRFIRPVGSALFLTRVSLTATILLVSKVVCKADLLIITS